VFFAPLYAPVVICQDLTKFKELQAIHHKIKVEEDETATHNTPEK